MQPRLALCYGLQMPRSVKITVPASHTDLLVDEIKRLDGVLGVTVQRGISAQPPGDVVSADLASPALHRLMLVVDGLKGSLDGDLSVFTSQPVGAMASADPKLLGGDSSEATWEEMELTIGRESNMTINGLSLMAVSGAVAAVGIATDAIHLVIGAMIIAPGFEPITRIALGAVAGGSVWRRGLTDMLKGYPVLIGAAAATALILDAMGTPPLGGKASYLSPRILVGYWTSITGSSVLATATASIAGAVLIASNRSVLTAGVMIALALVPSAAIFGMAMVKGEFETAGDAAARLGVEICSVALFSALVFAWKRARVQRRRLLM